MARMTSKAQQAAYEAAEQFRDRCLKGETSLLFPQRTVWTLDTLTRFHDNFVKKPDQSDRKFMEKFEAQVRLGGPEVALAAADALAFYFLFPDNVKADTKWKQLQQVLGWDRQQLSDNHPIRLALEGGIGGCGTGYSLRSR